MRLTSLTARLLGALITTLPLVASGQGTDSHAPPNTAHTKRIAGTVARTDKNEILLKAAGGTTETYQLSPTVQIARSRGAQMSDLTTGQYVGCINLYGQSDEKVASECSILPDGLRALVANTGDAPTAQSAWVSGTISNVRAVADPHSKGPRLEIQISDRDQMTTMAVTAVTTVTILTAADATVLKAGTKVRGVSQLAVDGTGVIQTLTVIADAGSGTR